MARLRRLLVTLVATATTALAGITATGVDRVENDYAWRVPSLT